jgi:hypothetical protein
MTKQHLQEQLAYLRARYDSGAVSPAVYATIKELEKTISWLEHNTTQDKVNEPA